jgi:hypothetical protein
MLTTGYVQMLFRGKKMSLKDWAMGVGVNQNYDIKQPIEPDSWHKEHLDESEAELKALRKMSDSALLKKEKARRVDALAYNAKQAAQEQEEWDIVVAMQKEVEAWKAPKALENLRGYMLQMLNEAIERGNLSDYFVEERAGLEAPIHTKKLRAAKTKDLKRTIAYHKKEWKAAIQEAKKNEVYRKALLAL